MKWSEGRIGRILVRDTFIGDLCVLPNCKWTGDEIDLLVVTMSRRVIDVEIKISRADLKRDGDKEKWWQRSSTWAGTTRVKNPPVLREWPRKVWKHYYAMPAELWRDDLNEHVQPHSGVLLVHDLPIGRSYVECQKRSKPNRDAETLADEHVVQIARLASLRMWDSYLALEKVNGAI
jgi:hypothetical protein